MQKHIITAAFLLLTSRVFCLEPTENDVFVRVVDVGAGLCCVVRMPGPHYMVYDAGNWKDGGNTCLQAIHEIVPPEDSIDLLVLSHTDSDHLGAVDKIVDQYYIKNILHTGAERFGNTTKTLKNTLKAIQRAVEEDGTTEINLRRDSDVGNPQFTFGETTVTMVAGFGTPPEDWTLRTDAERNNAISIVVRLDYMGKSVLFCGDAVGRHIDDPIDALECSEKHMVENAASQPIDCDVLLAPHHGADNGSSTAFIQATSPSHVIFSAGHDHEHPRSSAAKRYRSSGLTNRQLFRTDWGDDEGGKEWKRGRRRGAVDRAGDDDVDVVLSSDSGVLVDYRAPNHPASPRRGLFARLNP